MAFTHLVKKKGKIIREGQFKASPEDHLREGGELYTPGLFVPADEERVQKAVETYKKVKSARKWLEHEGENRWKYRRNFFLGGFAVSVALSGMAGLATEGLIPGANPLWFGAHETFHQAVGAWPGLFGTLAVEMGAFWFCMGQAHGSRKKGEAQAAIKAWDGNKFLNDELIHVFTHGNQLNPRYAKSDLYLYEGKPLPESCWTWYTTLDGKRERLPWTRFQRDGKFQLVIGEVYERDGRLNDAPVVRKIPIEGLYTGILVIGPPGSGKSQATLLPMLDQFIGYYHWVPDEKDLWLTEIPVKLERMAEEIKKLPPDRALELQKEMAAVQKEYVERKASWDRGEDFRSGMEMMAGFLWEPKSEMWFDVLRKMKSLGRERDYIELGVVPERFNAYQKYVVNLRSSIGTLWSYQNDSTIVEATREWLIRHAERNVVPLQGGYRDDHYRFDCGTGEVRLGGDVLSAMGGTTQLTFGAVDELYDPAGDRERWLGQITGGTPWRKFLGERALDEDSPLSIYASTLNHISKHTFSPWCFPLSKRENAGFEMVGPYGFGTSNEPWKAFRQGKAPREVNAQAIFGETVDLFSRVFGAVGGIYVFGDDSKAFFGGDGGFLRPVQWGVHRGTIFPFLDALEGLDAIRSQHGVLSGSLQRSEVVVATLLAPGVAPNAVLMPAVKSVESSGKKDEGSGGDAQLLSQMLSYFAADRVEFTEVVRTQVRLLCPIVRRPDERKADYRIGLAQWRANRRWVKWAFIQALLNGLDDGKDTARLEELLEVRGRRIFGDRREARDRGLAFLNGKLTDGGGTVSQRVWELLLDQFFGGMVEAVLVAYKNHPMTMGMAVTDLAEAGWEVQYRRAVGSPLEQVLAWLGHQGAGNRTGFVGEWGGTLLGDDECPYDSFGAQFVRPGTRVLDEACEMAGVTMREGEGNPWPSLDGFHRAQRQVREMEEAVLLGSLLRRGSGGLPFGSEVRHPLVDMFTVVRRKVESFAAGLSGGEVPEACRRVLRGGTEIQDLVGLLRAIRKGAFDSGLAYRHEPGVTLEEPVSEAVEDFQASVDTSGEDLLLGPWDAVWSEFVGERLWESLATLTRNSLAAAMRVEVEVELALAEEHPDLKPQGQKRLLQLIEQGYRGRGAAVLERTLGYFRAVEKYLGAIAPHYKTNTPMTYGYHDAGGIGDCQGVNKYNPVHAPQLTPDQLTDALTGVINRTASDGDTDFWINNAGTIAAHRIMLLRAGLGYVTVANLKQMCESDGFEDLVIRKAQDRIARLSRMMNGQGDPAEVLRRSTWGRRMREVAGGRAMPMEVRGLVPRQVSNTELNELRELYSTGSTWVNEQWRKEGGQFADDEVRGNSLNTLFTKLNPLTVGPGLYAFCPESEDENSFPTWPEVRTQGKVVVYRMQHSAMPIVSGLVSGMAIASYYSTVLAAKGKQTEAKEVFKRNQTLTPKYRVELAQLRDDLARLKAEVGVEEGSVHALSQWLQDEYNRSGEAVETPGALAHALFQRMLEAEKAGAFGGALTARMAAEGLNLKPIQKKSVMARIGVTATVLGPNERILLEELARLYRGWVNTREESQATSRDRITRIEERIWVLKQEIKNLQSDLEEFMNFNRYFFFVVDEYQNVKTFASKRGGLSDETFLAEARAGQSINVFCTQSLATIKKNASEEAFNQFFTNVRIQICLGSTNEWDQRILSDFWRGRKVLSEGDVNFSINYDAVDKSGGGEIRGSKAGGVNKTVSAKWEMKKWVEPDDLADTKTMRSWVKRYDAMQDYPPEMVYHIPYYLLSSEKTSRVDGRPLAMKTFLELIRDGELDVRNAENFSVREALLRLKSMGADVEAEIEGEGDRERALRS